MTRAISRDSFNELKQYLGVHLQQGRVILDSDWNEGQDIMANLARRLGQDAFGEGVLDEGFEILPVVPISDTQALFRSVYFQGGLPLLFRFPLAQPFDAFESVDGWTLSGPGKLRLSKDQPYEGTSFLRVSDHTGQVELARTLPATVDLSAFQFGHFRYRLNQALALPPATLPGTASFFIEDELGKRNVYRMTGLWNAKDRWTPNGVLPLDLHFGIFDLELFPAVRSLGYRTTFVSVGASSTVSWSVTAGTLPPGVTLAPVSGNSKYAQLTGTPTASGLFNFTITATTGSTSKSRAFMLRVQEPPARPGNGFVANQTTSFWDSLLQRITTPMGTPADLTQIARYGFQIFQQSPAPLIWDFDALYFGNHAMINQAATNNFLISGPQQRQLTDLFQDVAQAFDTPVLDPTGAIIFDTLSRAFDRGPRVYSNGLACTQTRDILYSEQADPDDPPLTPPTNAVRQDLVYLDVWLEPVTYVEDPELREIALGGPDTATRMQIRQRVRVAQGGTLPTGNGMGTGTLSTEGSYTDRANRLYLIQIDTAGDIGTATFRWSEDNGSTIQRVIEAIPPGSTKLKVEDASAFQPGDFILLRKEFRDEQHRIAAISGNTITLQEPTGSSVTFALADRPKIQRWNGFHVPIVADSNDSTVSAAIALSHGVAVRFGGKAMKRGDVWTFRARYLAGDDSAGISSATRIEALNFELPQGVKHYYAPLAQLTRDPGAHDPNRVEVVSDRRRRSGHVVHHQQVFTDNINFTGPGPVSGTDVPLGLTSTQSTFLCIWVGTILVSPNTSVDMSVGFFSGDGSVNVGRATTIFCQNPDDIQTGVVLVAPTDDAVLAGELVVAHVSFSVPTGVTASMNGSLDVFEFRNGIKSLFDIASGL